MASEAWLLLTGWIILSNKKRNLRKYSVFLLFKAFSKKKKVLDRPYIICKDTTRGTQSNLENKDKSWPP